MIHSEKQYIEGLKRGDTRDFEALYRMYASRLYRYVYSVLKNRVEAEDLVQELFLRLWNHRERIVLEESLSSLLFTMARNQLVSRFRSTVSSPVFEDYVNYCHQLPQATNHPASAIEYEEFCRELQKAKRTLNVTQKQIFELSKEEGLSNKEIALQLNLSEQTVRNQLSIALQQIRKRLKHYAGLLLFIKLI